MIAIKKPKYEIRKRHFHTNLKNGKDYVFLLSIVSTMTGTAAMWSTHECSDRKESFDSMTRRLQRPHNKQIDDMIMQEYLNEPEEFKIKTVQKVTQDQLNK